MFSQSEPFDLFSTYLRMRADASVEVLPVDKTFWERIAAGQLGTFHGEYLVSCYSFDTAWSMWEVHPKGDEIICLLSGSATFLLENESGTRTFELKKPGACIVIPKGTWHTAKAESPCRMLFITPGEGTTHREATAAPTRLLTFDGAIRQDPEVERWFVDPPSEPRSVARKWFEEMRACGPDVVELLHDGHPTACVEDAAFGYVNAFKAHVNVGFFLGTSLKDPAGILEGSGRFMRHVKVRPGASVNEDALRGLIRAAYVDIKVRLDAR